MRRSPIGSAGMLVTPLVCLLNAAPAHAYRNAERFQDDVMTGGGGMRFFTGSRAEGYTCQVCHTAGAPVDLTVTGLPVEGYVPGETYRITLDWPDDLPSVAVNLEMTDANGARFGELSAPAPTALSSADLCTATPQASTGAAVVDTNSGRRVVTVSDCGQQQTSVDWRAPAQPGQGWFSSSLVVSNRDGKIRGDRVVDVAHVFGAQGSAAPLAGNFGAGCSALQPKAATNTVGWFGLLMVGGWCVRRRARRGLFAGR